MPTVSATELARNAREILDMVASRGEIVMVERNRSVVARITPPERIVTAAQAVARIAACHDAGAGGRVAQAEPGNLR